MVFPDPGLSFAAPRAARAQAELFLDAYGALFGVADAREELRVERVAVDRLGATHVVFGQHYRGLPVYGARLVVHADSAGRIRAVNGTAVPDLAVDPNPALSPAGAATIARRTARASMERRLPKPLAVDVGRLQIYREGLARGVEGAVHLVYEVTVSGGPRVRELFYVDAHSGAVVDRLPGIHDALERRVYDGKYAAQRLVWSEGDAQPFDGGDVDAILDSTAYTYDLFAKLSAGSYLSYDAADHAMEAVAALDDDPASPVCPNAYWNGVTTNFCPGVSGDDVVAHEWTHAYTEYTGGLIYAWQPGALNEAYSDIFGEIVDLTDGLGTDTPDTARAAGFCSSLTSNGASWQLAVASPVAIAGMYPAGPAAFGPDLDETGFAAAVVLADDGDAAASAVYGAGSVSDACQPLLGALAGEMVLADRGGCPFVTKAANVQAAGGGALLVANNNGDAIVTMGGSDSSIVIPCLFVGQSTGEAIKSELTAGVTATMSAEKAPEVDTVRWLVSEDVAPFGGAIRDMWSPECKFDPGRVSDVVHYACSSADSGGVHSNSAVPAHAFALLVDGGSYNGQTVAAIGLAKATAIYWRALSVYTVPTSDFADHADGLEQSCADLIAAPLVDPATGLASAQTVDSGDCAQVAAATAAVELRASPDQCSFARLLAAPAPPLCGGGATNLFFTDDFESDPAASWSFSDQGVYDEYVARSWQWRGTLPSGRTGHALFAADDPLAGDCVAGSDDQSGVVEATSPPIVIPEAAGTPRLAFSHYVATEYLFDGGLIELSVNGGPFEPLGDGDFSFNTYTSTLAPRDWPNPNPLAGEDAFTGADEGSTRGSWGQSQIDLGRYARPGDTVRLRFSFGTDGCGGRDGWYVDDLSLYSCAVPGGGLDPFMCYRDRRSHGAARFTPQPDVAVQTVLDSPSSGPHYSVSSERLLCAPATTSGTPVADPATHLSAYRLGFGYGVDREAENLRVDDRFGSVWLDMRGAQLLMLPAAVDTNAPPAPPDTEAIGVDAYKCFKVRRARRSPRFRRGLAAEASDGLGGAATYSLRKPLHLCAAASVDGGDVHNQGDLGHLLCYLARRPKGTTRFEQARGIYIADAFGNMQVDAVGTAELCVPATIGEQ